MCPSPQSLQLQPWPPFRPLQSERPQKSTRSVQQDGLSRITCLFNVQINLSATSHITFCARRAAAVGCLQGGPFFARLHPARTAAAPIRTSPAKKQRAALPCTFVCENASLRWHVRGRVYGSRACAGESTFHCSALRGKQGTAVECPQTHIRCRARSALPGFAGWCPVSWSKGGKGGQATGAAFY